MSRFIRYGLLLESKLDAVTRRILGRVRPGRPLRIVPFHGYGTKDALWLKGRVLRQHEYQPAKVGDSRRHNARRMARRFMSREVPHATVAIHFGSDSLVTETNDDGYYEVRLDLSRSPDTNRLWHAVTVQVLEDESSQNVLAEAIGKVLVPLESRYGVISDIDDTVLVSYVHNTLRLMSAMALGNAYSRVAYKGVAALYQALQSRLNDGAANPIFYISNSPWNLYDFLDAFMQAKGVPQGPIYLRDFGLGEKGFTLKSNATHKLQRIQQVLDIYPHLRFLLIGDSSEHDPWIYEEVARDNPGRIQAVYIRDVRKINDPARAETDAKLRDVVERLAEQGVDMILSPDTIAAAEHALKHALISEEDYHAVQKAVQDAV